jgi:SAM-dependent methyltransferase
MDLPTLKYYEKHAPEIAERYGRVQKGVANYFNVAFPPGARVLDIGMGTGRDVAKLNALGWSAYGIEPSKALLDFALARHPELRNNFFLGSLPDKEPGLKKLGGKFDGILCSAVLQHLPRVALFDSLFAIKSLLKPHGRVLISIPEDRPDIEDNRDKEGRLFTPIHPD